MHWNFFSSGIHTKHVAKNMLKPGLRGPGWPVRHSVKNNIFVCVSKWSKGFRMSQKYLTWIVRPLKNQIYHFLNICQP